MKKELPDVLVVGAGFAGSVCAREIADAGFLVRVIDRRSHIGGNAWDETDLYGFLIHPYGPHIFHTNSRRIMQWLSRYTTWRFYEHRVLAYVNGDYFPIPINRNTLCKVFGIKLEEEAEVENFLLKLRESVSEIRTSEDIIISSVGRRLCDMFFRGYTRKQWGLELSQLSPSVAARIPVRTNDDDRYFSDHFQFMPADGYGKLFQNILNHPKIEVVLERDYADEPSREYVKHTVYTGQIDAFFEYCYGRLPYRSLRFEHFHVTGVAESEFVQPAPVVNFPGDEPFTRITEFKQLTGQRRAGSSLVREFPTNEGEPYYPVPTKENEQLFKEYQALQSKIENVSFVGRLAQYRYYNMDQVIGAALTESRRIIERLKVQR
ncbi:MAG: UDP-galactopyranose mutase [Hydrogenophilus sp.]